MPFDPTEEQLAILRHDCRRHAQVLAGPGTGKSTTMVALLDRLLQEDPSLRVRMLTFTRAATAELAGRVASASPQAERPSTIHSFAISILLRNPGTGGFPEPLRMADTWEFKNIVRPSLAVRAGIGVRLLDKLIREMASNWESLTDEDGPEISEVDRTRFRGAWNEHRRVLGYTLLGELPYALRRALHDHDDLDGIDFDLLLVDEYQDLNSCDLEVVKLLSEKGGCAVIGTGDDDQSIYSWRKAAPIGIRRFPNEYVPSDRYSLSVTLRCGRRIIEWANYVIQGDPGRPADRAVLDPHQSAPDGEVALLRFAREKAEAKGIAALVDALLAADIEPKLEPKDVLILMRTDNNGTFSKPIRMELEELGITSSDPSYVVDLLGEDDNRRVLELTRLLVDPEDSIAWASLLHLTDSVGTAFFNHVYGQAKENGWTFADELRDEYAKGFPGAPRSAGKVSQAMQEILSWLDAQEVPEARPEGGWGRWIIDLVSRGDAMPSPSMAFCGLLLRLDSLAGEEQTLGRYLGQVEPLGKDLAQAESEGVRIMTMSGSKGLTVRATIIAGVEDGLVPRPACDPSEERRILYVAMTRAKEYLFCTWASRRSGPTARAGGGSMDRRRCTDFLEGGPVPSQDGWAFLSEQHHRARHAAGSVLL